MRLRRKHAVLGIAAIVVPGTLWYLLRWTPIVPNQVGGAFTRNLLQEHGYRLEMERVRGNPLGEMLVEGIRVRHDRAGGAEVATLRALALRLDISSFLRGRVHVQRLRVEDLRVRLTQADLAWRQPSPRATQAPSPPLHLDAVEITGGHVEVELDSARTLLVDSLHTLVALELADGEARVQIDRIAARLPLLDVELRSGSGKFVSGKDGVRFEDVRLQTLRSQVEARGTYEEHELRLTGDVHPLMLDDLAAWVELPVDGRVDGPITFSWRRDALSASGMWSGRFETHDFDSVQVELAWTPEEFTLRRARGSLQGSAFDLALQQRGDAWNGRVALQGFDLRSWNSDLPASRLRGTVEFARQSANDTLDLVVALGASDIAGCALVRGSGRVGVHGRDMVLEDLRAETRSGTARGSGRLRSRVLQLDWELEAQDVAPFMQPLGLAGVHGEASMMGRVEGTLDSLGGNAAGGFTSLRYGELSAAEGELELQAERLWPRPDLAFDVHGEGLAFRARKLGRFTGSMVYDGEALHLQRGEVAAGDTVIALAATLRTERRDWNGDLIPTQRVSLHTALVQISGQEFRVEEPATIWWRERAARVDSLRLVARSGRARIDGTLDLASTRIDMRTEIRDFDLGLLARLASARQSLAGSGTGWIELHGPLDATQVDSRLLVRAGRWNALEVDSVKVDVQSDAFGTSLRDGSVHSSLGRVRASGRIAALPSLRRWLHGDTSKTASADLTHAELEAEIEVGDMELEPFWRGVRGIQAPGPWDAQVTARIEVGGSIVAPRVGASGQARRVHMARGVDIDSLRFEAQYAEERLRVPQLLVEAAGARMQVEGTLPLSLHLLRGAKLLRDEEVDAQLTLEQSSFAVVPRFISLFELAPQGVPPGTVEAELHVGGSFAEPKLRGSLQVTGAGFTLANLEEVFYDVHAKGTFGEDTLELSEIRGRTGPEGWVRGSGRVRFARLAVSDYDLAFDAEQVPIYSVPDITATLGGHLQVQSVPLVAGMPPVPEFKGTIRVHEAEITREFTAGGEESGDLLAPTDRPDWLAEVAIEAPGRVWVRNSNADAELAGTVQLVRNTAGLDVDGRATVKRGHYSAYLEKFEITRGELDFSRNPGWEPVLDIEARRGRVNERIYVNLRGTPSEPRLVFTSDTRGSSDELQQILMADISNDPASVATTVVENVFTDLGYLDSITIDPASSREPVAEGQQAPFINAYNVSAGWAVSDRVFVTYTRGLNQSDLNQRVAVEFDVLRGLLLASSWEIRYIPSPEFLSDAAQNAFNVDVKFRHEY